MPNEMSRADVAQKLTDVFHEVFDDDNIVLHDAMTAKEIAEWDSLNHINLVVAVEKAFKIKFNTAEIARLANVGQFIDVILKKVNLAP